MQGNNATEKKVIELKEVSLNQDQILSILKQQQKEFRQYSVEKRKSLILQRIDDIKRDRMLKSDGTVHHSEDFRKANKALEYFQPEFPILKFPEDTVLNTYDKTKRWLKEFDFPNKKQYWQDFKKRNFKHYPGQPFSYAPGVPTYFEEFKAYHHIEHEESQVEKYQRLQQKKVLYVQPTKVVGGEFSRPIFDRTHVHVELNPIHQVQYLPNPVSADSTDYRQLSRQSIKSKLNDMQRVKPFTSCSTRSQIFQLKYKPMNAESTQETAKTSKKPIDDDFDI
ncbi:unnamed protein product [Paramecium pentaurelia]|uniref:Uncharacterized protein n=1 Tax=Paramecium pentaurelia TaxID=43138 RepID=A0A8S1VRK3_9CILI|nr:unnamed protein product [Paramecium pentaurelia]